MICLYLDIFHLPGQDRRSYDPQNYVKVNYPMQNFWLSIPACAGQGHDIIPL